VMVTEVETISSKIDTNPFALRQKTLKNEKYG
jgi:hypothetical protein